MRKGSRLRREREKLRCFFLFFSLFFFLPPPPSLSPNLTLVSENSHAYCLTASAVPWNHSLSVGVCVAASTSTKPSPPKRTPLPTLYVRARWRLSDVELNWVIT